MPKKCPKTPTASCPASRAVPRSVSHPKPGPKARPVSHPAPHTVSNPEARRVSRQEASSKAFFQVTPDAKPDYSFLDKYNFLDCCERKCAEVMIDNLTGPTPKKGEYNPRIYGIDCRGNSGPNTSRMLIKEIVDRTTLPVYYFGTTKVTRKVHPIISLDDIPADAATPYLLVLEDSDILLQEENAAKINRITGTLIARDISKAKERGAYTIVNCDYRYAGMVKCDCVINLGETSEEQTRDVIRDNGGTHPGDNIVSPLEASPATQCKANSDTFFQVAPDAKPDYSFLDKYGFVGNSRGYAETLVDCLSGLNPAKGKPLPRAYAIECRGGSTTETRRMLVKELMERTRMPMYYFGAMNATKRAHCIVTPDEMPDDAAAPYLLVFEEPDVMLRGRNMSVVLDTEKALGITQKMSKANDSGAYVLMDYDFSYLAPGPVKCDCVITLEAPTEEQVLKYVREKYPWLDEESTAMLMMGNVEYSTMDDIVKRACAATKGKVTWQAIAKIAGDSDIIAMRYVGTKSAESRREQESERPSRFVKNVLADIGDRKSAEEKVYGQEANPEAMPDHSFLDKYRFLGDGRGYAKTLVDTLAGRISDKGKHSPKIYGIDCREGAHSDTASTLIKEIMERTKLPVYCTGAMKVAEWVHPILSFKDIPKNAATPYLLILNFPGSKLLWENKTEIYPMIRKNRVAQKILEAKDKGAYVILDYDYTHADLVKYDRIITLGGQGWERAKEEKRRMGYSKIGDHKGM